MFEYNYFTDLTLEELNQLGNEGWEITGILINKEENIFDVFVQKGFQEKTLITNETTGAKFWVNETFSYGEAITIIFITIFTLCIIGKIIYNWLFKNA